MFQRLKGAIDSRIAEEQARQRQQAIASTPTRPAQRRRPLNPNGGGSRTSSRQREQGNLPEKGPDPSEFEPEFTIGEDESAAPSRTGTPKPPVERPPVIPNTEESKEEESVPQEDEDPSLAETNGSPAPPVRTPELPSGIQAKLKKLDRLESKYGELLKAYRIAHARILVIEPFEASLREHTPLTGINDPTAFVEYLGQVGAKGDMVLDEFKRVSAERDDFKKRAEQAEDTASQLRFEVAELKKAAAEGPAVSVVEDQAGKSEAEGDTNSTDVMKEATSPTASLKSPASTSSRIPSFSLFSPRAKPTSVPRRESEDLFSYDSEVPRLENELQDRQQQVEELKSQMKKLKGDLIVARESTEGMVMSLESATRELHELREAKDKFDEIRTSLEKRIEELQKTSGFNEDPDSQAANEIEKLRNEKSSISRDVEALRQQVVSLEESNVSLKEKLDSNQRATSIINEKLAQKDSVVKDLEDTLAMMKSAERQAEKSKSHEESSGKKLSTMQGIMNTLRSQLNTAETTVRELRDEIKTNQEKIESRPSSKVLAFLDEASASKLPDLSTRDDVVNYLASNFGLKRDLPAEAPKSAEASSVAPSEASAAQPSKKKNKKKKKGKAGQTAVEEQELEGPVKVSENLAEVDEGESRPDTAIASPTAELESTINSLRTDISTKDATIDRLSGKLKDQEALQEEIETLRDDLLHQGEEHVEARDKLKSTETERQAFSIKLAELEKELQDTKAEVAAGADSNEAHQKSLQELEDLRNKTSTMQIDLNAAEQVAASRFKDLTELREVLSKAQHELKTLRAEVADLKTAKEDLKNKTGELNRLESRYEDLKSEMKGLGKRLGDKDAEIKELQQKIEQETSTRTKMEEELRIVQSELRVAETRKNDAVNVSSELSQELKRSKQEAVKLRGRVNELEDQVSSHSRQVGELREEISLKTTLHTSSQSVVQSLRDQTHELTTQAREATARAENLEEELAEAQRMLSERTREGQTMRMLLNQSETGTESRVREMRERMDAALEERDRIEDEASVSSRRMMRELDEARNKVREAQRGLKVVEDEKEEMEVKLKEWKRRGEELEQTAERASREVEDVRAAMAGLREALNESERQVREMEVQRTELRRVGDEAKERLEKLTRANKNLTEEVKALQATAPKKTRAAAGIESGVQSSRTSLDSSRTRSPAPSLPLQNSAQRPNSRSEQPTNVNTTQGGGGLSQGTVDYVYLKNVLLQFLEQKDKAHQRQLIPVIGMLLHFDRKDEQKWVSAISSR